MNSPQQPDLPTSTAPQVAFLSTSDKYQALTRHMHQGFCIIQVLFDATEQPLDYRFLEVNPSFEQRTGLVDAVGKTMRQLQPAHEQHWFELYAQVVKTGQPAHVERQAAHLAGGVWYDVFAFPFGPAQNHQVAILFDDITQRKGTQAALQVSEERFRLFVTTSSDVVYTMSADWRQMKQLEGKTFLADTQMPSREWLLNYIPVEDRGRVETGIDEAIAHKRVFELEHRVIQADGQLGWTLSRAVPILNQEGHIQEWLGTASDITERKAREHQQAFLLTFSDALRAESSVDTIASQALEMLSAHLSLDRCYVAMYHLANDRADFLYQVGNHRVPPLPDGGIRLSDFPQALGVGFDRTLVIEDVAHTEGLSSTDRQNITALGLRALVATTLRNGSIGPAWVIVAVSAVARRWRPGEVALLEEATERTWAAMERARVEKALQASEHFVQGVIRSLPLVIYLFDLAERRNRYLSPQVTQLFGYTIEQMQRDDINLIDTFYHPDDQPRLAAHFEHLRSQPPQAPDQAPVFAIEYRISHPQRGWVWVESRDTVYTRDAQGKPTLVLGTAEDITERRASQQAVAESEKRLRLAIEATEMATWEWNLENNEVYWNEQHFWLFGMEPRPNPLSPDEFMRHVHPREQARIRELLERTIAERGVYDAEFLAVLEDGSQRWMSGYGRITEERAGQPIRMSGVMFDVDERRRAEDALRLADQRKDEFLAMLAHELRNPMSTLRSGLQILTITDGNDATSRAALSMMNRQTDHLVRMVDDLLDVSRISRGKIDLKTGRVNLVEVVGQAVESVRTLYQEQARSLVIDLGATPVYLEGDATRLSQVVANLLTNGARYTGEGGKVWLSLAHTGQEAVIQVRDNGIGLAPNQLTAIFELFVQVDNSIARSKGGLGLGLTLVKRLVELHGGRVEAQSDGVGQGSTFTVHLPTVTAAAQQVAKSTAQPTDSTAARRILVIDDNADAALTLGMLLKLKGYEAHTRTSGRAGLEAAEAVRPEAILLDIGMPDLDGYATCRLIREQPWGQDVLIVALTGYGQEQDRQRTREAGFDGHLVKPVGLEALTKLLTDLLGKRINPLS